MVKRYSNSKSCWHWLSLYMHKCPNSGDLDVEPFTDELLDEGNELLDLLVPQL